MYCTYLTVYSGNKLPPFYIGHSTVLKVQRGYRGSVKSQRYKDIWKAELKSNPHLFKTSIITMHSTREEAKFREESFQLHFKVHKNPMYINMAIGALNFYNKGGHKHSQETKNKISKSHTGKKREPFSDEWKSKMSATKTGKIFSQETKNKIGAAHKGKIISDSTRGKISEIHKGKKLSEETKLKISQASKRQPMSETNKRKLIDTKIKPVRYKGINYNSIKEAAIIYAEETGFSFEWARKKIKSHSEFSFI